MAFGLGVYVHANYTVAFFDGSHYGRLIINRDDRDGGGGYPLRVGTNNSNGNGAYLTAGGVWTDVSSRSKKENFRTLDGAQLLREIETLPVTGWSFKESEERHIGPVAEDFYKAFGLGKGIPEDDSTSIAALDLAGVSLVAVQELIRIVRDQQEEIDALKASLGKLESNR
jgi:hypothetical protein